MNRGHDISLKWVTGGGTLLIDGTQYVLQQCHWHSPFEHTINGIRYPLEIHIVHETAEGKTAVIAILYRLGKPDPFLEMFIDSIKAIPRKEGAARNVSIVDPNQINRNRRVEYYRYMGSLTVPPCTEGVIWIVNRKVSTVSSSQVRLLRDAVHEESNARPLQSNNQMVQLYIPRFF